MGSKQDDAPTRRPSPTPNRQSLIPPLLLLLLAALFLWRLWTLNPADRHVFAYGDFVEQFYPLRRFAADELRAGRLPLWNPHIYSGTPALADPQWAALYPPAWLAALLPPWPPLPFATLQLEAGLHLALAGVFTFLFARRHLPTAAALLAAIVFAFGGYLTSYPPLQLAVLETAAWLPFALWGAEALAHAPAGVSLWQRLAPGRVALAALPLALALLAGHPQTFALIAYTAIAYYAFQTWGRLTWPTALARLALWLAATLGLTAAQWLPTLELARLGPRLVLPYEVAAVGFVWRDLLHILLPGVWGDWSPLYVGLATLLLAGLALAALARRRAPRDVAFWAGLAVVGILLSLGAQGGLYWLAYRLAPGFSLFRHQERAAILWSFGLAMLAGYGLAAWLARGEGWRARGAWLVAGLMAIVAVGLTLYWAGQGRPAESLAAVASAQAAYSAGMLALAALAFTRGRHGWGAAALVALVALDLFSTSGRGLTQAPPPGGYFAPNPIVWAIQADQGDDYRVSSEGLLPPGGGNGAVLWDMRDTVGNSPLYLADYDRLIQAVPELTWWRLLGVRYVVSKRDLSHGALAEVERIGDTRLYRLAGSLPPAWVAPAVRRVTDKAAALAALAAPGFDPLAEAVTADPVAEGLGLPTSSAPLTAARVEVKRVSPTERRVTVDAPQPGLLVLAESHAPGWQATVNGVAAPVLQVDGPLLGTPIPGGPSVVEWRYAPRSFSLGALVSLLALVVLVVVGVRAWRQGAAVRRN